MCSWFFIQIITGWGRLLLVGFEIIIIACLCLKARSNVWAVFFFVLVVQKSLQRITTGLTYQIITYLDEIVEIAYVLILVYFLTHGCKFSKKNNKVLVAYVIYVAIGILSSAFYNYANLTTIILDVFVCTKFIIFYKGAAILSQNNIFNEKDFYNNLNSLCKIFAVIVFFLAVHDIAFAPFFEKFDFRYFTYSIQLCFQHPTYLAAACFTCMTVLMYGLKYDHSNMKYITLLAVVTCLTFRTKAIVTVIVVYAIYFSCVKYRMKTKWIMLLGVACFSVYIAMNQFEIYFTEGSSVPIRLKMLRDSISIASEHFPLGAGFGSFGTTVAYESGSKFYYSLGYMSGYYEGQPVADAFWPGIIAEAGLFGTFAFVLVIVFMLIDSFRRLNEECYSGWCMVSILIYAIIASTSETAFFNPATAIMFIIYGILSVRRSGNL